MELFRLSNTFYPGESCDKFETLVWTERFAANGDFKLVSKDDISSLSCLPIGALVTHTETDEVMIVENHEVKRNEKRELEVTITGRSFEVFSENRVTSGSADILVGGGGAAVVEIHTDGSEEIARNLLRNAFVTGVALTDNAVANVTVTTDMRVPDTSFTYIIPRGDVYNNVLKLLNMANAGIRARRVVGSPNTLDLYIHDGLDLSGTVIFYAAHEDLDNATYFFSNKDYRNYAQVAALQTARLYRHRDIGATLSGLDRRTMYVEARDLEDPYTPATATDEIAARGQSELDLHPKLFLLQATVSKIAAKKFKFDYNIGDLVTVFGEFSLAQVMRVTEYILTVDKNGMSGYPALSAL